MSLDEEILDRSDGSIKSRRTTQPPPPPPESDPQGTYGAEHMGIDRPQTNDAEQPLEPLDSEDFPPPVAASGRSGLHEEELS